MRRRLAALALCGWIGLGSACSGEGDEPRESTLDTRLETHAVLAGQPTAEGLAYLEHAIAAHREADAIVDPLARAERLIAALELAVPERDGVAEIAALELSARASEALLEAGADERVLALLGPRLPSSRSLPIDRASARCLVALGDAAARTGDHALAMGSYARALEMLSLLLEEVDS
ncbi:hypothetical protein ACNOYE_03380 [Nannocystaceae bacterium ST9]